MTGNSKLENRRPGTRPLWRRALSSPWAHLVAAILVVALVQALFVKVYQVPSGSMQPTLEPGDRVLVNKLAYLGDEPEHGDVIVFDRPESWGPSNERPWWRTMIGWFGDVVGFGPNNHNALTKRVIGTPGDAVACCDAEGRLTVNGEPIEEPYIFNDLLFESGELDCSTDPVAARCFREIVLSGDEYLVMGDHRSNSADSVMGCRGAAAADGCARIVTADDIVGEVFLVFWPLNGWGRTLSIDLS
ncbi:signal peptidase I [Agromyces sp. H66]|uniref:signal peptidase I n=1 Tax=Agromyces sp. H66 TaxID=2529859 RepID=UPI0010AB1E69|nr:signal peptidase I [Agromyces sp. H66]